MDLQAREKGYDLEANLALLKLYQFNPTHTNMAVVVQVVTLFLCNFPHTDFFAQLFKKARRMIRKQQERKV